MDIGKKIKAARIAKGMTQEELGQCLGVQKSAIAKYESGRVVNIKRTTLKTISDILDIHPSELIYEKMPIGEEPADIDRLSNRKKEFIKRVALMSDEELDRLEQILALVESKGQ